jgi:hypothetical protein
MSAWYDAPAFVQSSLRTEGKVQARFGLPCSELVIGYYSCALKLKHSILLQGRVYIFPRHLGFACDLLGQVRSISLKFSDIISVRKAKTALVVPNAIDIQTINGDSYFFASFLSRNEAYRHIHDLWTIAKGVAAADIVESEDFVDAESDEYLEQSTPFLAAAVSYGR